MNIQRTDWLIVVIGLAFGAGALLFVPRLWRGEMYPAKTPNWWPWGVQLWRAWLRTGPIACIGFVLCFVGVAIAAGAARLSGSLEDAIAIFAFFVLMGFVISMVSCLTITLFNWPKSLVPPLYRSDRGLLPAVGRSAT